MHSNTSAWTAADHVGVWVGAGRGRKGGGRLAGWDGSDRLFRQLKDCCTAVALSRHVR